MRPAQCFLIPNTHLLPFFLQDAPLTGRKADVLRAAHLCAEAAIRLVKPGNQVHVGWFSPTSGDEPRRVHYLTVHGFG